MIRGAFDKHQPRRARGSGRTSHFQADEAVIVRAGGELERAITAGLHLYFRHHVLGIGAAILRPPLERSDPGIAGRGALPFCGQSAVRSTGANPDPMVDVAVLGRHKERAGKGCARLKFDHVAATSVIQGRLQIAASIDGDDGSRRGRVDHRTENDHSRQFRGTIVIAASKGGGRQRSRQQEYQNAQALCQRSGKSGMRGMTVSKRNFGFKHLQDLDFRKWGTSRYESTC